ncbi:OsmC family protein [Caulobacter segnis]|uniref:OsmC family protein n=1 Tax=Caulobacter segnis TaxID=88688 RepID=UPI00240F156C|nr:OsmC family protein [Caulobacter segnis]MDG2523599.1 OsmC family protein [Caulobacter segnis]
MARAKASISDQAYVTAITTGRHALVSDEPPTLGGQDMGPAPYDLLLASLGSCTAITLKMYADRKGWPLAAVHVDLHYAKEDDRSKITRTLRIEGDLNDEQRARLADIAERTPVTLTLRNGADIATTLAAEVPASTPPVSYTEDELDEALEESFPASDAANLAQPRHSGAD